MKKAITILLLFFCLLILFNNYSYPSDIKDLNRITLLDQNGAEIYSQTNQYNNDYVRLDEIPLAIQNSFIQIEDKRFYSHHGFDLLRIVSAFFQTITGTIEGEFTITQQTSRMLFLTNEKTLLRKIKEFIIALRLEKTYSKKEILECYLNNLYFGNNIYGIKRASLFFFEKELNELSSSEIALLVGIIKGPSVYSPLQNPTEAFKRQKRIARKLNISPIEIPSIYGRRTFSYPSSVLYYKDIVLKQVKKKGVRIETCYDSKINELCENMDAQICAINPKNGKILSIYSGNYHQNSFNRCYQSNRAIASTIKPFLYYEALACGYQPLSEMVSQKTTFEYQGNLYMPSNYNNLYPNQAITMIYALATSDNMYAVKTLNSITPKRFKAFLEKVGLKGNEGLSLALGSLDTSLFELTSAYQILSNLGTKVSPYFIEKITYNQKTIYKHKPLITQILNEEICFCLNEMMTFIFNTNINDTIKVTGSSIAHLVSNKYAAKSGSGDFDSYMMGFHSNLTLGVRISIDDNQKVLNDNGRAKRIWISIMNQYGNQEWYPEKLEGSYEKPSTLSDYKCKVFLYPSLPKYKK